MSVPRGICSHCELEFGLRSDGTLRAHGYGVLSSRCPGSHHPPKGAAAYDGEIEAVRYDVRTITVPHRHYGVWDHQADIWYQRDGHTNAFYAAGVPMWKRAADAQQIADNLNKEAT